MLDLKVGKKLWLILVFLLLAAGCDIQTGSLQSGSRICSSQQSPVFVSAWEEQLQGMGITYTKKNETTLCYQNELNSKVGEARFMAEPIYRGAATIVSTSAERQELYEWIRQNKREYREQKLDSERTFVVVFSGSEAQLEDTQVMFSCLQYYNDCLDSR